MSCDLTSHYDVQRLCFSLETKSASAAVRASKSINQHLEDYWLGLRLQNMDIPAIQVVKSNNNLQDNTIKLSEACELYLWQKGVGLLKEDIKVNEPIPHIDLKPYPWRTLKTKGSQRLIALTNEALWAYRG